MYPFLSISTAITLVQAHITSVLEYYKSHLISLPPNLFYIPYSLLKDLIVDPFL